MSVSTFETAPPEATLTAAGLVPVALPIGAAPIPTDDPEPDQPDRWVTVLGEPTATAGLVITPGVGLDRHSGRATYLGLWTLTHQRSGRSLLINSMLPRELHDIAARLDALDWTRTGVQLETDEHARALVLGERRLEWD